MKTRILFSVVSLFLLLTNFTAIHAGLNIVVIGSSTAADGSGWVTKYANYLEAKDASHTVINLAKGGYTTYMVREDGFQLPAGKESQAIDTERNITKALSYFPDVLIFAFPSNDYSNGNTDSEVIDNYNAMIALAQAQNPNVKCYVTSPQPTNFSETWINGLMAHRDAIKTEFGAIESGGIYIDFWTTLANGTNNLKEGYYQSDGQHLTDAGQTALFEVMKEAKLMEVWGYDYAETAVLSNVLQNPIKINFGNTSASAPWNGTTGSAIVDLMDTEGNATGISMSELAGVGTNGSGNSNTTTSLDMPNNVSSSACYKTAASTIDFSFTNLSDEINYKLTIYASRNDDRNSSATYTVIGTTVQSEILNASLNTTQVVVFDNVSPNNGEIAINIAKTNDNAMGYIYINALMIEPVAAQDEGDYSIAKTAMSNGDVILSKTKANENDIVTLTIVPDADFELSMISVTGPGGALSLSGAENTRTFTMPNGDVSVSATFVQTKFNVVKDAGMTNGYVSAFPVKATSGETIYLAAMSATDFILDGDVTVTDSSGDVTLGKTATGWTFTMPAEDVTVSASFLQTMFNITKASMTGGDVTISAEKAAENEIITLTVVPATNYVSVGAPIVTLTAGGDAVTLTPDINESNKYTFTMPASDVKISVTFKSTIFNITKGSMSNGDVTISSTPAEENDMITLTLVPDQDYEPDGEPVVAQVLKWRYEAEDAEIETTNESVLSTVMTNDDASGGKYLNVRKGDGVKFNIDIPEDATYNVYVYGGGNRSAVFYIDETHAIVNSQSPPNWNGRYDRSLSGSSSTSNKVLITERAFTAGSHYVFLDNKTDPAGYELQNVDCIEIERVNAPTVHVTSVDALNYTFTMPATDVIVSAAFKSEVPRYNINKANMVNGDVALNYQQAEENEEIIMTIVPNSNFELDNITVTPTAGGSALALTSVDETTRKFTMPDYDVTVSASFKKSQYSISKTAMTNGSITIADQSAAGETVNLTVVPDTYYELDAIKITQKYEAEEAEILNEYPGFKADHIVATETAVVTANANASGGNYVSTKESCVKFHITIPEDGNYNLYAYLLGSSGNREALFYIDCSWYMVSTSSLTWNERHVVNCIGDVSTFNKKDIVLDQYLTAGEHYVLLDAGDQGAPGYWNIDCIEIEKTDGSMVNLSGSANAYSFMMPACDLIVSATFKDDLSTIISESKDDALIVFATNGELWLNGLTPGEFYSLYTIDGKQLLHKKATANKEIIPVTRGAYIIVSGNNQMKVIY